ncbi:MAG: hypothetical protein WCA89_01830 [Terracidiphilus sp.]
METVPGGLTTAGAPINAFAENHSWMFPLIKKGLCSLSEWVEGWQERNFGLFLWVSGKNPQIFPQDRELAALCSFVT